MLPTYQVEVDSSGGWFAIFITLIVFSVLRPMKWRLIRYSYHFNCLISAADLSSGGWFTIVITLIVLLVLPTYQVEVDSLYLSLWLSSQCCRPIKWRLIHYSYHFNCLIGAADLSSGGWFTIVIIYHFDCLLSAADLSSGGWFTIFITLIVFSVLPTYEVEVDSL